MKGISNDPAKRIRTNLCLFNPVLGSQADDLRKTPGQESGPDVLKRQIARGRYGCRAFGFKSQQSPIRVVLKASGDVCQYRKLKLN